MASKVESAQTDILLVGFQDQDNLGLRYLISSIHEAGFTAKIITYQSDPKLLVELARSENPYIIGFSLIFQYMAPDFAKVIKALRDNKITAHITMGGHYPSFDYEEVLEKIPYIDSIVRFEGEETIVELLQNVKSGGCWQDIHGIAYRTGGSTVATRLRQAIADLDRLPLPYRENIDYESDDFPTASILGSRGCPWDCSFCSIRPFYEAQGGKLRRLREPSAIVAEMVELYRKRGVSTFLFQDDDFMAGGVGARKWASQIANEIIEAGLQDKIVFKISCRSDEISEESMYELIQSGLTHIYMGVESGDEQGLSNLNKRLGPQTHIKAGRILKSLDLSFDFGFMLLEPYSTFEIVRNNIDFLDEFVGDGWTVASFCRMLPYAGTPVKQQLEAEGRMLGSPFEPDYKFLDPRLDLFYDWMLKTFYERNFTNKGLSHVLKSLLFEAHIKRPDYQVFSRTERSYLHHLTAVCNGVAFYTLRTALDYLESEPLEVAERDSSFLDNLTRHELVEEAKLMQEVADLNWSVRQRSKNQFATNFESAGSFENSWTLAEA